MYKPQFYEKDFIKLLNDKSMFDMTHSDIKSVFESCDLRGSFLERLSNMMNPKIKNDYQRHFPKEFFSSSETRKSLSQKLATEHKGISGAAQANIRQFITSFIFSDSGNVISLLVNADELEEFFYEIIYHTNKNIDYSFQDTATCKHAFSLTTETSNSWFVIDDEHAEKHPPRKGAVKRFLEGAPIRWHVVYGNEIVRRDVVDDILQAITEGYAVVLLGAGGEGKSTSIMQACVELHKNNGKTVLYHRSTDTFDRIGKNDDTIYVVDDPSKDSIEFTRFCEWAFNNEVRLIIGCRENEWNAIKQGIRLRETPERYYKSIRIPEISKDEAERFASCVEQYIGAEESNLTHDQIVGFFTKNSYGFLYASMLMVMHGTNELDEIAKSIIKKLSEISLNSLILLAHVVMCERIGISCNKGQFEWLCKELGLKKDDAKRFLALEVKLSGGRYETRHMTISNLFYNFIFEEEVVDIPYDAKKSILLNIVKYRHKMFDDNKNDFSIMKGGDRKNTLLKEYASIIEKAIIELESIDDSDLIVNLIFDKIYTPKFVYDIYMNITSYEAQTMLLCMCYERHIYEPILTKLLAERVSKNPMPANFPSMKRVYEPREIYKTVLGRIETDHSIWISWADYEKGRGEIGDFDNPAEYTTRWIYREVYSSLKNVAIAENLWLNWARMEQEPERGRLGSFVAPEKYTARWVFREAFANQNKEELNENFWLNWARLEQEPERGRLGSFDAPEKYTARWIFREAFTNQNKNALNENFWLNWARLEQEPERGRLGSFDAPEKYTARWIYREAFANQNIIILNENFWLNWARLEQEPIQGSLGSFDAPEEYTSRWIYRKAYISPAVGNIDENLLLSWALMEQEDEHGELGDFETPKEFTARWIYRKGCEVFDNNYQNLWLKWALMEQESERGNLGSFTNPEKNTARWIYHEACLNQEVGKRYNAIWNHWCKLEIEQKNKGNPDNSIKFSAYWIFNEAPKRLIDADVRNIAIKGMSAILS